MIIKKKVDSILLEKKQEIEDEINKRVSFSIFFSGGWKSMLVILGGSR